MQGLFHNRAPQIDRLRPLRSLAAEYFPGAPSSLRGTELHQELRQHPAYLVRRLEWQELKSSKASQPLIKAAKTRMDVELARLRRKGAKNYREEWIKTEGSRYLQTQPQEDHVQRGEVDSYILPSWRTAVVDLLFHPTENSPTHGLYLVRSLRTLLTAQNGVIRTCTPLLIK